MGIFIFLNAFIHTVMHTYYAITAAGVPYPAKPLITFMQISQFVGGFIVAWPYKDVPCFRASQSMMFSWVFNYFYVGSVLSLFMHFFYNDNFNKKKKAAGAKIALDTVAFGLAHPKPYRAHLVPTASYSPPLPCSARLSGRQTRRCTSGGLPNPATQNRHPARRKSI